MLISIKEVRHTSKALSMTDEQEPQQDEDDGEDWPWHNKACRVCLVVSQLRLTFKMLRSTHGISYTLYTGT